ncbi:uncharacterized protein EV154DRAFT_562741 [Mucor mucedo]|uniref:uncharacterized protein n=1 Tax=Mucor mucedo TaxID=29922 RepID=UPI002220EF11|nr:uncharacterized protein EV154DRAFT_562741 [Mucor mucedo]KAI7892095.1 hypothetical protein EV154DRAFT_562741 [Mucor mucedo]
MSTDNYQDPLLERTLSWQDVRDTPSLSTRRSSTVDHVDGYRYVDCSNRKYRKPPLQFSISITSIDGNTNKTTCHPGSIFEGMVHMKLDTPLAAEHLRLVFKASERIHHEAHTRKRGERLFAIKTVLWGSTARRNEEQWPLIESGEHQFPFMCEIPMVNYPPTYRNHLASCVFELMACLDRPGIRPFQTVPTTIRYEPYIVSTTNILPNIYQQEALINNHKVLVTLSKGCSFNLLDRNSDLIKLQLFVTRPIELFSHIEVFIKRNIQVSFGAYQRSDSMVMSHVEQSSFGVERKSENGCTYYIRLPIPTEISKHNNPTILKNFSVFGMTPSFDFSRHVKMDYKLHITAKIKTGLISSKRELFAIPLHFGTVASGEPLPPNLLSYRDPQVIQDTTLSTKPRFIKATLPEEQLPAYDHDLSPPEYSSGLRSITSS